MPLRENKIKLNKFYKKLGKQYSHLIQRVWRVMMKMARSNNTGIISAHTDGLDIT